MHGVAGKLTILKAQELNKIFVLYRNVNVVFWKNHFRIPNGPIKLKKSSKFLSQKVTIMKLLPLQIWADNIGI